MTTAFHDGRIVATNIAGGQITGSGSPVIGDHIDGTEGRFAVIVCGTMTNGGTISYQLQTCATTGGDWQAVSGANVKVLTNGAWAAGAKSTNESRTVGWYVDMHAPEFERYVRVVASTTTGNYNVWVTAVQWGGSGVEVSDLGVPSGNFQRLTQ